MQEATDRQFNGITSFQNKSQEQFNRADDQNKTKLMAGLKNKLSKQGDKLWEERGGETQMRGKSG